MSATKRPRAGKARLNLRIDLAPGCAIGPGKIALLEAILGSGSLSEGARSLGMSYRRAWLLLDDLNRSFDGPVAVTATGGSRGGGAQLTELGLALIREYRGLERDALKLVGKRFARFQTRDAGSAFRRRRSSPQVHGRGASHSEPR